MDPATIDVHDPVTGDLVAQVATTAPHEVPDAARRARVAGARWAALPWRDRATVIARFHDLALDRADEVLDTVQRETGKARRDALSELVAVAGTARHYLAHGRRHLATRRARPFLPVVTSARTLWLPHGLVGLITPWNFPFLLAVGDALPALLAGAPVLVKPSELTPCSALLARDLLAEAGLDADLFQPLVGSGSLLGPAIIDQVDHVGFTGSTATGREVAIAAARRLVPCSLELGGKNPMLVLEGAPVDAAARGLLTGAFANTGQTCISIERAYVHESVWEPFTAQVRARVSGMRVASDDDLRTDVGALVGDEHAAKVRAHLDDALARGARVLAQAPTSGAAGNVVAPTVLVDTDDGMVLHDAETFGPVVRLERVASSDEAIARANDSDLGLNASVWAGSTRTARAVARRLEVGTVGINSTLLIYASAGVPMGGVKRSGIGRRHGAAGIQRYAHQQSVVGSVARWGGVDGLLSLVDTPVRLAVLLRALRAWRRLPGLR